MNQPAKQEHQVPFPENTIFLVPDVDYDKKVIDLYLKRKYKTVPKNMIVSQVNMQAIPHVPGLRFIVCVRRREEGVISPDHRIEPDQFGKQRVVPIPHEEYVHEVVESAPIKVTDHVQVQAANMFTPVETNLKPLIQALGDAALPYRVFAQNKPDFMIRCVVAV